MNNTNRPPRRFGDLLTTDQRGPDEAVMLMRLVPDQDDPSALEFHRCLVIAALRMFRRPTGLMFDITDTPSVTNAAGKPVPCLANDRLPHTMRAALERLRAKLRARSAGEQEPSVPPAIVDQLRFFVFEKGDAPVTLEWRIDYAGKSYPLQQPVRSR